MAYQKPIRSYQVIVYQDCLGPAVILKNPGEPPVDDSLEILLYSSRETPEEAFRAVRNMAEARGAKLILERLDVFQRDLTPSLS